MCGERRTSNMNSTLFLLLSAVVLSIVLLFILVLNNIIRTRIALAKFKKVSNGLPILDERGLIGNHVSSVLYGPNMYHRAKHAHEKYGKTFGWLYNLEPAVFTVDLDLIKLIVIDEPQQHVNKLDWNMPIETVNPKALMFNKDEDSRRVRRIYASPFKSSNFMVDKILAQIENPIKKVFNVIENKMAAAGSDSLRFEMDDLIRRCVLDIIFTCLYNKPGLIDMNAETCKWSDTIDESAHDLAERWIVRVGIIFSTTLGPPLKWFIENCTLMGRLQKKLRQFIKEQAIDRCKKLEKNPNAKVENVIDYFLDAYRDKKLTKKEMIDSTMVLLLASFKTNTDSIIATAYLLGMHQDEQNKLRESLKREGLESGRLKDVLQESMRLMPAALIGCSRVIKRDIKLDSGHILPAGTFVMTPSQIIHRLKEYWGDDADDFKPDRWSKPLKHPCQYLPFGAGARKCIGAPLAMLVLKVFIYNLVLNFKIEAEEKEDFLSYQSPHLIFVLANSPTWITLKKIPST